MAVRAAGRGCINGGHSLSRGILLIFSILVHIRLPATVNEPEQAFSANRGCFRFTFYRLFRTLFPDTRKFSESEPCREWGRHGYAVGAGTEAMRGERGVRSGVRGSAGALSSMKAAPKTETNRMQTSREKSLVLHPILNEKNIFGILDAIHRICYIQVNAIEVVLRNYDNPRCIAHWDERFPVELTGLRITAGW